MSFAGKVGTKDAILITLIFKQFTLNCLPWLFSLLFWNAHDHKPAQCPPTGRLVKAAVIFNLFTFKRPVPAVRIKGRIAAFVGNDEIKTRFHAGRNTGATQKFAVSAQ